MNSIILDTIRLDSIHKINEIINHAKITNDKVFHKKLHKAYKLLAELYKTTNDYIPSEFEKLCLEINKGGIFIDHNRKPIKVYNYEKD